MVSLLLYELDDVFVNHEGLIFRRGRIYPESFAGRLYDAYHRTPPGFARFLIKNYWLRRGSIDIPAGIWAIDNLSYDSWHHWVADVLTCLVLAEELYPEEHLLLLPRSFRRHPYVTFSLQAFP